MKTKEFLNHFKNDNTKIEFIKNANTIITEQEALENKKDNIYYLGGVDKKYKKRAGNKNIIEKNYFVLDLDIAKNFEEEFGEKCSYDDIVAEAENLAEYLKDVDDLFGEFSFIVVSGGGIHIYYMGDFKNFDYTKYSLGVNRIYRQWNKIMGAKSFEVDFACSNIARILRLPGSINQKNGKECKIIYGEYKKSRLFDLIESFAEEEKKDFEKQKEEDIKKRAEYYEKRSKIQKLIDGNKYEVNKSKIEDIFKKIDSIPAYIIAEKILPQFVFDGKKNFKNDKKGYTAYFYIQDINAICNGGSRHFSWGDVNSCYTPSVIIKNEYNYTWREVIKYFRLNFNIN